MWEDLTACLFIVSLSSMTVVHCQNSQCRDVELRQSVTFDCSQNTESTDRFILWHYLTDSISNETGAASCYFSDCNVTDSQLFAITDSSSTQVAKTKLTLKKADTSHSGWTIMCYVLDFQRDVLLMSSEYRLLVYNKPTVTCTSERINDSTGNFICSIKDVYPKTILCKISCEDFHQVGNMTVEDLSNETHSLLECKHSYAITLQSYECKISVVANDSLNGCEYSFGSHNVSSHLQRNTKDSQKLTDNKHKPNSGDTGFDKSYLFSMLVAAVVIPISVCTLLMVIRQRRRKRRECNSEPTTPFPEYIQQNTSRELVSADNTTCFSDDSENWSIENESNIYSNIVSNYDIHENEDTEDPTTLPFEVDHAANVASTDSIDISFTAALPAPHTSIRNLQTPKSFKSTDRKCRHPSREQMEENTQLLKILCNDSKMKPSYRYSKVSPINETSHHRECPQPVLDYSDHQKDSQANPYCISCLSHCSCQSVEPKRSRMQKSELCQRNDIGTRYDQCEMDNRCKFNHEYSSRDADRRPQFKQLHTKNCIQEDHHLKGDVQTGSHRHIYGAPKECHNCHTDMAMADNDPYQKGRGKKCHHTNGSERGNYHCCSHNECADCNFHTKRSKRGIHRFHNNVSRGEMLHFRSNDKYTDNERFRLHDDEKKSVTFYQHRSSRDGHNVRHNCRSKGNEQWRLNCANSITTDCHVKNQCRDAGQSRETLRDSGGNHTGHRTEEQVELYIDPCVSESSSARSSKSDSNTNAMNSSQEEVYIDDQTVLMLCSDKQT